jgi:hypothetical protein
VGSTSRLVSLWEAGLEVVGALLPSGRGEVARDIDDRLAAFAYGTGAQREQWRALIATLESLLRLHSHRSSSLVKLDEYLYRRSGGMIGSLSHLLRGAAIVAIEDGSEQITKKLLDSVPVDYAAQRADTASRLPGRGSRAIRKQTG